MHNIVSLNIITFELLKPYSCKRLKYVGCHCRKLLFTDNDIKAHNIVLLKIGDKVLPKIIDFNKPFHINECKM